MKPDNELLRQYAKARSEEAFAELVKRHVDLVYSAALRQVGGDAHLAHDVAQNVFTDLARKAGSLSRRESLTGWLYTSAHFAASKLVRTEHRRREREEEFMREPTHDTPTEADWEKLRPILDAVMHDLKETDREAVLLRYFENRPYTEVGAKLGINENTARMRVERALEKLRALLAKRAVTTTAGLASIISANAVQVAPHALAANIAKTSLVAGTATSLAFLKSMTLSYLKLGIGAAAVAGVATMMVLQNHAQQQLRIENESMREQLAQLRSDNTSLSNQISSAKDSRSLSDNELKELLNLRAEITQLRSDAAQWQTMKASLAAKPAFAADPVTNGTPEQPPQVHLKAKFVSVPEGYLQNFSSGWVSAGNGASVISEEQFDNLNNSTKGDENIRTLGTPQVVTLNGREASLSITEPFPMDGTNINLGTSLNVVAYYSMDTSGYTLNIQAEFKHLTGDASQPILETIQETNQVNLFPDQTVVLSAKISPSANPNASQTPNRPETLLIFITPTPITSTGNRFENAGAHPKNASAVN